MSDEIWLNGPTEFEKKNYLKKYGLPTIARSLRQLKKKVTEKARRKEKESSDEKEAEKINQDNNPDFPEQSESGHM